MPARPGSATVWAAFAAIVARQPAAIALRDDARSWTYVELQTAALGVASALQTAGARPGDRIAVLARHEGPSVAAFLGTLAAGMTHVPLDRRWRGTLPDLLADVAPGAVLTDGDAPTGWTGPVVRLATAVDSPAIEPAPATATASACIVYTSGATGQRKGVVQPHATVLRAAREYCDGLDINPEDRVALLSPLSSGASVSTLFGTLLAGACVCMHDVAAHGVGGVAAWLATQRVTVYQSTATLLRQVATIQGAIEPAQVRVAKLGGEPVSAADATLARSLFGPGCRIVNGLGVTEAGGNITFIDVNGLDPDDSGLLPVGFPLPGLTIDILDEAGQAVSNGAVGEVAVTGPDLADGYWRRPDLTAKAFERRPDGRVRYRTGDIGRVDAEGRLWLQGRRDWRVKIGGSAIDLADVEARLRTLAGGRAVAVVPVARGGQLRLAAVVEGQSALQEADVRSLLAPWLPAAAVPVRLLAEPAFPRLASGKVDRAALATLAAQPAARETVAEDVRDPLVQHITALWRSILGLPHLRPGATFFDLGGDSIQAVTVVHHIETSLGVHVPLQSFMERPTVTGLADLVRQGGWDAPAAPATLLDARGIGAPLFLVPPAGGQSASLRFLAFHLGGARPVYALQPLGVEPGSAPATSVEEDAGRYVEAILRIQPRGPILLAGASFGGVTAFEAARILNGRGRPVAFLGLFDTFASDYPRPRRDGGVRSVAARLLDRLPPDLQLEGNAAWAGARTALPNLVLLMRTWLGRMQGRAPMRMRLVRLAVAAAKARRRYAFPPYRGQVDLFRARVQPPTKTYEADATLGWSRCTPGGLVIHDMPGTHLDGLRPPHVEAVARELAARLAEAETASARAVIPSR